MRLGQSNDLQNLGLPPSNIYKVIGLPHFCGSKIYLKLLSRKHFLWRSAIHTYTVFPDIRPDRNKETLYVPIQLKTLLNNHLHHITFMTQSLSLPLPSLPTLKWSHLSALLVVVLCFVRAGGWSGNPVGWGQVVSGGYNLPPWFE